jgi:hypothetical protein
LFIPLSPRCQLPAAPPSPVETEIMGWLSRPDPKFTEDGLREGIARIFDAAAAPSDPSPDIGLSDRAPDAGFTFCFTARVNGSPGVGCRSDWRSNPAPSKGYAELAANILRQRLTAEGWMIEEWQADPPPQAGSGAAATLAMTGWTWLAHHGGRLVAVRRQDMGRARPESSEVEIFVGREPPPGR